MPLVAISVNEIAKYTGLKVMPVPVAGTGSMYPSLFWEKSEGGPDDENKMTIDEYRTTPHMYRRFGGWMINGKSILRRPVKYGDMVAFANETTVSILQKEGKDIHDGFIKRVIGVPGDVLELRDGYVYKNGNVLDEPYIYKPRSTYGGATIADCTKLTVPDHKYVVMGDNRKLSSDSRGELGLVDYTDISFVLPYGEQKQYQALWRDTSKDAALSGTPTLDSAAFLNDLNKVRVSKKVKQLRLDKQLTASAVLKGNHYLIGDTNYALAASLEGAGYHNIVSSEFVTPGHYDADELLANLLYFSDTAKAILDDQYQDLGIAAVTKNINGCPTQVIVGHLGGYIPASYDKETVSSWEKLQANLESVIPSWEKAAGYSNVDQGKLSELLTILRKRLALAREIVGVMRDNKWLSDDEQARIKADSGDASRADQLINELNKGQ
jgi:signal peptidase I